MKVADILKQRQQAGDDVQYYIPSFTQEEKRSTTRTITKQVLSHDRSQVFLQKQTYQGPERTVSITHPFLTGYVLVKASFEYLKTLDIFCNWVFPIIRPGYEDTYTETVNRYITVPESQVKQFQHMIDLYKQAGASSLSLHTGLVEGDAVRIVSGPFAGFEGVLQTSQGKEGGRVTVKLTQGMYYDTLSVPMDDLEVLSFSKRSYHVYKKFNAYYDRILRCMENIHTKGSPTQEDLAQCVAFLNRYRNLQLDTENARARHYSYMLMTYAALNMTDEVKGMLDKCKAQLKAVRTDLSRAFISISIFVTTKDADYLHLAEELAAQWDPAVDKKFNDKKYKDMCATIERFKKILKL